MTPKQKKDSMQVVKLVTATNKRNSSIIEKFERLLHDCFNYPNENVLSTHSNYEAYLGLISRLCLLKDNTKGLLLALDYYNQPQKQQAQGHHLTKVLKQTRNVMQNKSRRINHIADEYLFYEAILKD